MGNYLSYFFYIGWNWSFSLAFFIIRHEIKGEKKYGVNTIGIDDLHTSVGEDDREHASIYQPVNYYTAEQLFDQLSTEDVNGGFLDIGCGRGRVLAIAAAYGFTKITGIDFSPKLCHEAIQLCDDIEARYPKASIVIDCADAREFLIPKNVTVLFLFNPFDKLVMVDFIKQVMKTVKENPRNIKVLYANPQCKKEWLEAGFEETFYFQKMKLLEGSILEYNKKLKK